MTEVLCSRPDCGHAKDDHDPQAGFHPCTVAPCECAGYRLPACSRPGCGHSPELHVMEPPHGCEGDPTQSVCTCGSYVFPPGYPQELQTHGGGFGGGGATGGW